MVSAIKIAITLVVKSLVSRTVRMCPPDLFILSIVTVGRLQIAVILEFMFDDMAAVAVKTSIVVLDN